VSGTQSRVLDGNIVGLLFGEARRAIKMVLGRGKECEEFGFGRLSSSCNSHRRRE
jgi:hypothetical protein